MKCQPLAGRAMQTLALILLLAIIGSEAQSQNREAVLGMSQRVFTAMELAQAQLDANNIAGARTVIEGMLARPLSDYERAHGLNLLGYTWYQEEQLDLARTAYEQALALVDLPVSMRANLLVTLGQICLMSEQHVDAEGFLRRLVAIPEHNTAANQVLLAAALFGQGRHEDARTPLEDAVDRERAVGKVPQEQWLAMLSSVYYELSDFSSMRDTVAELATQYPREQYVMNLAALNGELGDSERQLALLESLADDSRIRNSMQIQMLASLFLDQELPYKAAVLLERALDEGALDSTERTLELLSQAWFRAAETQRAIEPLQRAAALSDSGELYMRLAHLHMDSNEWGPAERAAGLAIEKGGLREPGQAWLLRGIASVRMEQLEEANRLLTRAAGFDHSLHQANQWLKFVEMEAQRANVFKDIASSRDNDNDSSN